MDTINKQESPYIRSLIEASFDPLVTIDMEGKITGMNEALANFTGLTRNQLIGSEICDYFTEPQKINEVIKSILIKETVTDVPFTLKHSNGKLTELLFNGSGFKDDTGKALGALIIMRDVAGQKRESELRRTAKEIAFQNNEKEKRAAELIIANKELLFQNREKEKRAAELVIANKELAYQNKEKEKRAAELVIADQKIDFQSIEKEKFEIAHKQLEEYSYAVKLSSQYTRSIIEASLDPLFAINSVGKIIDVNEATLKATGTSRGKIIGTNFFNYFTEPDKAQTAYKKIFKLGFITDYPLTIKDGKYTDVLCNGSGYKDDQGNVLGVVIVARDVTEQKRIETELIEAKVFAELATSIAEVAKDKAESATLLAENAVKAKQQFLSNMSHEIRTPMNAIIGFTKVVLKTKLTHKQKEYLSAIKTSGDALIVLINDILDLAKVNSGKMTFEQIPFKMSVSVSAMVHLFETKIQEKNLKLVTVYDPNIPNVLVGDPVRLHQIILNLISNAVKFTAKGEITISIGLIKEDEEKVIIEFAVKDTGIGIDENKIDQIFENFQQASSKTSRIYGGTGLGLAIVKHLVESQGGTIDVKSKVGEGSTFSFSLDFLKTSIEAEIETEIIEIDKKIKNIKVLVVEDISLNQLLMKTLLDDFSFESDIAENGLIAIEKLKKKKFDIVLMDLHMPKMNGFEATDYIRSEMHSKIPIIALTADVTTVDLAKCRSVGMNDYIAKPVDERLLYTKIVGIVKKSNYSGEPKVTEIGQSKNSKCIDLTYLLQRTKSKPELMMQMIALYLEQTPPLIAAMKINLENKDWGKVYSSVHKLIPSFSIMGIDQELEDMAKKIQDYARKQQHTDKIPDLFLFIETVLTQSCEELQFEYERIKNEIHEKQK